MRHCPNIVIAALELRLFPSNRKPTCGKLEGELYLIAKPLSETITPHGNNESDIILIISRNSVRHYIHNDIQTMNDRQPCAVYVFHSYGRLFKMLHFQIDYPTLIFLIGCFFPFLSLIHPTNGRRQVRANGKLFPPVLRYSVDCLKSRSGNDRFGRTRRMEPSSTRSRTCRPAATTLTNIARTHG